jgi:hypothetical protein
VDVREALGAQRVAGELKRHRHVWERRTLPVDFDEDGSILAPVSDPYCARCGVQQDPVKSKRGRSARRRGNNRELELAVLMGGEKVGHHGGPDDVRLPLINVQSKVRKAFPYWMTTELAKLPRTGDRVPALIVTDSPGRGIRRRTIIVLELSDFQNLHGRVEEVP